MYALITGASKGIGRGIAVEFAKRKIAVLLVARSENLLQELSNELTKTYGIQANFLSVDLSEANASDKVFEWCSANGYVVKYLVNNAGYGLSGTFESYPLEDHKHMLQVNVNAVMELCSMFLPSLREHRGCILNIASTASYQALPNFALYAATKAFVLRFSRALHNELKGAVGVTCVSPGPTDTFFNKRANLGTRALKAADKTMMTPDAVAKIAVDAMFKQKKEMVIGTLNKLGAFMAWLVPNGIVEKTAGSIYD
jgi:uncharacterized protein